MAPFGIELPSIGDLSDKLKASLPSGLAESLPSGLPALPGAKTDAKDGGKDSASGSGWRSKLKPASFRGVAFLVDQDEEEGGRRAVTHEFPGRDIPYTEDLGKKAGAYTVEGLVLGADYMDKRDALLKACNAEGPGALIVPWMPERKVICTAVRKRETSKEGGVARFSMTFAEAGQAAAPTGAALPGVLAESKADEAIKAAGEVLNNTIKIGGFPLPVQEGVLDAIKGLGESVSDIVSVSKLAADLPGQLKELQNISLDDLKGLLPSEITDPFFELSEAYTELINAYTFSSDSSSSGDATASQATLSSDLSARVTGLLSLAAAAPSVSAPAGAGTVRTAIASNQAAIADYQRSAAVAEAARTAVLVRPASKEEAKILRVQVVDAIDSVLDRSTDEAVYTAFTDLRTATVQALAESAGQAPEVATVKTTAVLPALVLGQRYVVGTGYGTDATEAASALLTRNRVRHPGFVPQGDLEVLRAL